MGHGRYRPIVASSRLDPRWAHHRAGFYLCDKSLAAGVGPFPPLPPVPRDEVLGQASPVAVSVLPANQFSEFARQTRLPGHSRKDRSIARELFGTRLVPKSYQRAFLLACLRRHEVIKSSNICGAVDQKKS